MPGNVSYKAIMIYDNIDLLQFQRSRDRLIETLYNVVNNGPTDDSTTLYIKLLEGSIKKLNQKIEEFGHVSPFGV